MAKNNKKRRQKDKPRPLSKPAEHAKLAEPGVPSNVANEATIAADIKAICAQAEAISGDSPVPPASDEPRPSTVDLDGMWTMVRAAKKSFEEAEARLDKARGEIAETQRRQDERNEALTRRAEDLDARARALDERIQACTVTEHTLARRTGELEELATQMHQRELNAEAGFVKERRVMLAALERERDALHEAIRELDVERDERRRSSQEQQRRERETHRAQLEAERRVLEEEGARIRAEAEQHIAERESNLREREAELHGRQCDLNRERRRLEFEAEEIEELRTDLHRRAERLAAGIREQLEHRIAALEHRLEAARAERDKLAELLRDREASDRRFGQRSPEEILAELDALRSQRDQLEADLAARPSAAASERLTTLERERSNWEAEREELRRARSELERRLAYAQRDVGERETQRDILASLESQRALLFEANQQMRAQYDELVSRHESESAFPACADMDTQVKLRTAPPTVRRLGDLQEFVRDLRHRIAHDPEHPERRLYYAEADLRSFLGGLAMGRLILLQGISGTGKTSLPLAFARAVGGLHEVIEVQAGWRDPQDLVGHYNVFEKRFYERNFLKALYRAHTDFGADLVHVVLLDEMNLSHPEQYFSDMLSALERKPEEQRLTLMTHGSENAPKYLDEGSKLAIPPNVWFVGTANHDETTKDFADKTYDRAHVMELPEQPSVFEVESLPPRQPIAHRALVDVFDDTAKRHAGRADEILEFLNAELRRPLADDFGIGWGPRLERQMSRYVPVVVAAGGSVGEAGDHMLATRLLRKLKNRHDNRPEQLEALRQRIEESWPVLDGDHPPRRSLGVIRAELRRLGRIPEAELEAESP